METNGDQTQSTDWLDPKESERKTKEGLCLYQIVRMAMNSHADYDGNLSDLPRSLRWRIQLGLFIDPANEDPTVSTSIETCWQWNSATVTQQNERFKGLMEKYIEEEEEVTNKTVDQSAGNASSPPTVSDIDPLTAMVREQEERESRKAELYLKYRKEKARRKRGLTTDGGYVGNGESDGIDTASVSEF